MKIHSVLNGCIGLFIAMVVLSSGWVAAESPAIYYILDGSGSMWGRVGGRMKIEIAKEVMEKLISGTPKKLDAAVSVYGHRRKGDCEDIEEIVSLGPLDKAVASRAVNRIIPRGKTPISAGIKRAVYRVRDREENVTIVLVSDGIETCDADPCAVTKSLKKSGAKFILHVIGFGVNDVAAKQLSCVAEVGGGRYWSSGDAKSLLATLSNIQENAAGQAALVTPKLAPEPTASPKRFEQKASGSSTSIKIRVRRPGRIKLVYDDWVTKPYYWKLVDAETGEQKYKSRELSEQIVVPGTYQMVWRQREHGAREVTLGEVVTIESGKVSEVPLKTAIRLNLPSWVEKPYFWRLRDPATNELIAQFRPLEIQLVPPGEWNLVWRQSEHGARDTLLTTVTIKPDFVNDIELSTSILLARADWVAEEVKYWGLRDPESGKWVASFSKIAEPQLVPSGSYQMIYRRSEHRSSDSDLGIVEIKPGKLNKYPLNTGVKIVPPLETKPPYLIEYVELGKDGQEIRTVRQYRSWQPMLLKPGEYRVKYQEKKHGTSKMTLVEEFDLPPGALAEIEL